MHINILYHDTFQNFGPQNVASKNKLSFSIFHRFQFMTWLINALIFLIIAFTLIAKLLSVSSNILINLQGSLSFPTYLLYFCLPNN